MDSMNIDEESGSILNQHSTLPSYQHEEISQESSPVVDDDTPSSCLQHVRAHWTKAWSAYDEKLHSHPILTKSITAFFILGFGDLCGQFVEFIRAGAFLGVDWIRCCRFGFFGLAGAPYTHYYYTALDTCLPPTEEPCSKTTALKLAIDQFVQAPLLVCITIVALGLLKGESMAQVADDLHLKYMSTLWINWKLWIPANAINLALVAPRFRVLYVNTVFFWWGIILSILLNG